jgi:hypothetical protein
MKTLLLIISLTFVPLQSSAHEFFFSFVEMEYNPISQRIEMTLMVTTHDFEKALDARGSHVENIKSLGEAEIEIIEAYINKHFVISNDSSKSDLSFMGNEISLDGTSSWYFESEPIAIADEIKIRYDVMMEAFPDQQNKLTLYYEGETYTAAFSRMHKTKQLYFENKEQ